MVSSTKRDSAQPALSKAQPAPSSAQPLKGTDNHLYASSVLNLRRCHPRKASGRSRVVEAFQEARLSGQENAEEEDLAANGNSDAVVPPAKGPPKRVTYELFQGTVTVVNGDSNTVVPPAPRIAPPPMMRRESPTNFSKAG